MTNQKLSLERLIQNLSVNGNGHNLPRNEFTAVLNRSHSCMLQSATARNLHADNGHALNIVLLNDLSEFFAVVHIISLRAADQGHFAFQEFLMKVCVGVSSAVCGNEQACLVKVRCADRSQLDLYGPVSQLGL